MTDVKVLIIGGGFAGMALAILLQNHGIQSIIHEMRAESYVSGGNIALAPNGLRVLDHLGVYDKIRLHGYNYDEITFANEKGQKLGAFLNGSNKVYGYHALRINRTVVRDALREQCKARGIDIKYGTKCIKVEEKDEAATAHFADGTSSSAEYVIGADGIHSIVRSAIAPDSPPPYYGGQIGVSGKVKRENLEDVHRPFELPAMIFGGVGFFAIIPSTYTGDEVGYFATLEVPDRSREEWASFEQDQSAIATLLRGTFLAEKSKAPQYVKALIDRTPEETLTVWPFFYATTLDSWVSQGRRIALIGDSAHAFPPTGGQGAAMALEDAEALAHTLAECAVPLSDGDEAVRDAQRMIFLHQWDLHRHARVQKALGFTDKNRSWRLAPSNPIQKIIKDWTIWAAIQFAGHDGGMSWLYGYSAESVKLELY